VGWKELETELEIGRESEENCSSLQLIAAIEKLRNKLAERNRGKDHTQGRCSDTPHCPPRAIRPVTTINDIVVVRTIARTRARVRERARARAKERARARAERE
jgi:hypothetical protein